MTNAFPKHIEEALDSYKTPALSADFTDRLVEKAVAQSSSPDRVSGTSWKRRSNASTSPWKRGGYFVSGIAGFGLVSAAAAAALSLAEIPVRIPVVSDFVESVLPQSSSPAPKSAPMIAKAKAAPADEPAPQMDEPENQQPEAWAEMTRVEKRELLKKRVQQNEERVQKRRVARGLAPLTERQLKRRRAAIRRAVVNGDIPRPMVRRAVRRAALQNRAEYRQSRQSQPSVEVPNALSGTDVPEPGLMKNQSVVAENEPSGNASDLPATTDLAGENVGDQVSAVSPVETPDAAPLTKLPAAVKAQLLERLPDRAKQRLRQASPAERRRILREMKVRRDNARKMRQARRKIRDIRKRTK